MPPGSPGGLRLAFDARTIGDRYPGIGRYAFGLWQALGERVAVTIVDPRLRNTRFSLRGPRRASWGVRSPLAQLDLPRKLRDADLYYSPYFLMPYAPPCPAAVTLYDATPLMGPGMSAGARMAYRLGHRLAARAAARLIVLSHSAREEMAALGLPREKTVVCPPGLDPRFRPATAEARARAREKYAPGMPDPFWLCFGSARWHKNTAAAVEAAEGRPLLMVGGPAVYPAADNVVRCATVAEEDLPALYSAARGLIFPSLREGFGLPIIEAMACGTPVVCFPAPGVKEAAGDAAVMAEDLTAAALAAAARRLDDPATQEAKGEAGLRWAEQFTWGGTVEAVMSAACQGSSLST